MGYGYTRETLQSPSVRPHGRCILQAARCVYLPNITLHTHARTWVSVVPRFLVVEDVSIGVASKRHAVPQLRARTQIRA